MGKVFVFVNQKGGVGKTTSAINLGAYLANAGKQVLLVDFDSQANLTSGVGLDKARAKPGVYELISGTAELDKVIHKTSVHNLEVIPSGIDLSGAAVELVEQEDRDLYLKKALQPARNRYDYIMIDCPPSLGVLTLNGLAAADSVLIPMQCEYFAMEGLSLLLQTIKRIQKGLNTGLQIGGIFFTMYDQRTRLAQDVVKEVSAYFREKVFETIIPRNVRISEAPSTAFPFLTTTPAAPAANLTKAWRKRCWLVVNNKANKNRLGRGLSALLPDEAEEAAGAKPGGAAKPSVPDGKGGEVFIAPEKLRANPGQPRKRFDGEELEELAASIKQHGIIQPIIVDKDDEGNFVIIAGERRSRAAALAGLKEVPVIIRSYSDQKRLEVALIENIHRTDLNPIEEAAAYKQLMETAGLSQDEAAERVGKNRSTVANALRLLKLPSRMKEALEDGSLSAGHARAILSLSKAADQEKLFVEIKEHGLSVRAAEKRAAVIAAEQGANKAGSNGKSGKNAKREPELKTLEEKFIRTLGTKVTINGNLKKGRIEIEYYSMDDLDRLYGLLGR